MKRITIAAVLVLTVCLCFTGCFQTTAQTNNGVVVTTSLKDKPVLVGDIPCQFPLVEEPVSLNVLITGYDDIPQENVFVWREYEQMTGVDVNWTTVSREQRSEAVYTALKDKQNLDLIIRCKISSDDLARYGEQGLVLDLMKDDMLETYAPNCWAFLQIHPETLASVMNPDGSVYGLPQVNSGPELRVSRKILINKNWLKNVNMEIPKTTGEMYQLLKAFKEQDANGNGDPNDEIPLSSQDWASLQDAFFGAFGLANRGVHNQIVDCDEKNGGARLIAASDEYRAYLAYFHKLYSEGLLDKYMFTLKQAQWYDYAQNDLVGVYANTNLASLPADKTDDWIAVEEALEGPNGDKMWTSIRGNFHSTGAAVIPTACSNPELVLKWLDYFWTDEGTLFYHMGIEGESFVANEDGTYDYTPHIYEQIKTENKTFDDVVANYTPYPGGGNPTVEIAPYFRGGEMEDVPAQAARKLFEYGPKEYWPSFTFTTEENDRLAKIQTDITKYCETMRMEFITGEKSLSQWDSYLKQLDQLGAQELLSIYGAAIDRYEAFLAEKEQ